MDNEFVLVSSTAERLRERLDELGMRQIDLAKATGIDKGSIHHYLSGRYEPKDKAVYKMARVLDVNEMWLWGYDVQKERFHREDEKITIPDSLIEKSHKAADIVIRLNNDDLFCESVLMLDKLNERDLETINGILKRFAE